jgi:hypothetical protein
LSSLRRLPLSSLRRFWRMQRSGGRATPAQSVRRTRPKTSFMVTIFPSLVATHCVSTSTKMARGGAQCAPARRTTGRPRRRSMTTSWDRHSPRPYVSGTRRSGATTASWPETMGGCRSRSRCRIEHDAPRRACCAFPRRS